jgi:hypothetical protein
MVARKALELSSNTALAFAREMQAASYSLSKFTLDIDGKPTLVLQAKWQVVADELCRDWVQSHWDQVVSKGPRGEDVRPIVRIRLARSAEKAAYQACTDGAEFYGGVKIAKLVGAAAQEETQRSRDRSTLGNEPEPTEDGDPVVRSEDPHAS